MKSTESTSTKIELLEEQRIALNALKNKWLPAYILTPLMVLIASATTQSIPIMGILTVFFAIVSGIVYHSNFTSPFNKLKHQVKTSLLSDFMSIYHPSIEYKYVGNKFKVYDILKRAQLISADRYNEEDVIIGSKGNLDFYISEIDLENKDSGKNANTYHSIFKGILFKMKFKGRNWPKSQIYTTPNMFKRWFGSIQKNEEFGFWYETEDNHRFQSEIASIFPFIRHLSQQGDIRIMVQGDELILAMESKMKFLDDPKPSLGRSFKDESYYRKISQQLNSLLFIVDSFADELSPIEIEEKLKLRMIEYADKKMK